MNIDNITNDMMYISYIDDNLFEILDLSDIEYQEISKKITDNLSGDYKELDSIYYSIISAVMKKYTMADFLENHPRETWKQLFMEFKYCEKTIIEKLQRLVRQIQENCDV